MFDRALYYPHIRFRSRKWLRTAVLYHDEISRIVPDGFDAESLSDYEAFAPDAAELIEDVTLLRQVGFIRDEHPTSEIVTALGDEFFDFAAENIFDESKRRRLFPLLSRRRLSYKIHPAKIDRSLAEVLHELHLARTSRSDADWEIEPATAGLYLLFLASKMAGNRPLVTDNPLFQALLYAPVKPDRTTPEPGSTFRLATAVFESIAPVDPGVPVELLLRFREDSARERQRFKDKIDGLGKQLATAGIGELETAIARYTREIGDEVATLEDRLRSAGISCTRNIFAVSVPSYVTAGWALNTTNPLVIAGVTAIAVSAALLTFVAERRIVRQSSPWAYLLAMKRGLAMEKLASDIVTLNLRSIDPEIDPDEDLRRSCMFYML